MVEDLSSGSKTVRLFIAYILVPLAIRTIHHPPIIPQIETKTVRYLRYEISRKGAMAQRDEEVREILLCPFISLRLNAFV
jgi:hypothetical protein